MLNIKLKNSIAAHWIGKATQHVINRKSLVTELDHNDLAFRLATADDINHELPSVLKAMQSQLDRSLPENQQAQLFVLFSNKLGSETYIHHSYDTSAPPSLLQALHQQITVRRISSDTLHSLKHNGENTTLLPTMLLQHGDTAIWLLQAFDLRKCNPRQLNWHTSSYKDTLTKGLKAWFEREDRVKSALKSERAIYAAELHDSLAQILGYLRLKSTKLEKLCQDEVYKELQALAGDLATYTQCAYHQTRELITAARLTMHSESFSQGVTNSVAEFEQQSAIVFELDNRLPYQVLEPQQSIQVLYIIRESLCNIVRHSHATHARVTLSLKTSGLMLVKVEDNGTGIDPEAARSDSFGLQIMRERAQRIGAELTIQAGSESGTCVELQLELGDKQ